jgi:2-methylisocitrate lyase-like PEP mutase family enzyme
VPPTPQRPPSAAVSLVSGKPLPSPAEAAARIAAVQQRVRAALPALAAVAQEDAL